MNIVYDENDNLIELDELQDATDSSYENSATVTVTLYEADQTTEVTGETWPMTMGYVASSNGKYRGVLRDALSLNINRRYFAKVTADAGTDKKGVWWEPIRVVRRQST